MKIKYLYLIILILTTDTVFGQIFYDYQSPHRVKWSEINSGGFKVIYPAETHAKARKLASELPLIYKSLHPDVLAPLANFPIVLNSQSQIANGYVQLGPKKSEFSLSPSQHFDSQDWLRQLSIHELRHMVQFANLTDNQKKPFPELWYFAYIGLSSPTWFLEGDAVWAESVYSPAGRGKQAEWIMPYRSSLIEGEDISYSKAYFGSKKNPTPGYYQMGYLMNTYLRKVLGHGSTDSLLIKLREKPLRLYPFSAELKKQSGKNSAALFKDMQQEIKDKWQRQDEMQSSEKYTKLHAEPKIATDYFMPHKLNDGQVLALKKSAARSMSFVKLDTQENGAAKEAILFAIGYQEIPWFSQSKTLVVWDEIRAHIRYKNKTQSVLCLYNLNSGKHEEIKFENPLFAPRLSADAQSLVAVELLADMRFRIIEIDIKSKSLKRVWVEAQEASLQMPALDATGQKLIYVQLSEKGKSLELISDAKKQQVLPASRAQISRPVFYKNQIVFNAHYNGIDNLYSIDTLNKEIVALSSAKYGAFNFQEGASGTMLFNEYQAMGMTLAQGPIKASKIGDNHFVDFSAGHKVQAINFADTVSTLSDSTFYPQAKAYKGLNRWINFHSIIPIVEDEKQLGLELISNNTLNTLDLGLYSKYRFDEKNFSYGAYIRYKALFPIIEYNFENRARTANYQSQDKILKGTWRENTQSLSLKLPLSFSVRNHNYALILKSATRFTQRYSAHNLPATFIPQIRFPLEHELLLSHSLKAAPMQIASPWAQQVQISYFQQAFDKNLHGTLFALQSRILTPGLLQNHSLALSYNFQNASGVHQYDHVIPLVYGYHHIKAQEMLKNTFLADYRFPLAYPDWELGRLAYVKRIGMNMFAHYENIAGKFPQSPKSWGLELNTHVHLLRYQPLIFLASRLVFVNKIYNQNPILEFSFTYSL